MKQFRNIVILFPKWRFSSERRLWCEPWLIKLYSSNGIKLISDGYLAYMHIFEDDRCIVSRPFQSDGSSMLSQNTRQNKYLGWYSRWWPQQRHRLRCFLVLMFLKRYCGGLQKWSYSISVLLWTHNWYYCSRKQCAIGGTEYQLDSYCFHGVRLFEHTLFSLQMAWSAYIAREFKRN